jgi:hypothetical protein
LYALGFCYKNIEKAMLWRIVVSLAIVEVLLCVLPIELAGIITICAFGSLAADANSPES